MKEEQLKLLFLIFITFFELLAIPIIHLIIAKKKVSTITYFNFLAFFLK